MDQKQKILDFLKRNKLMVVSTLSNKNIPQSAVVEFGETDNLEIIFDTFNTARKYRNLKHSKAISFVIGWDENITVQYDGEATELEGEELEKCKQLYFKKNPDAQRWESREGMSYFKASPKWVRYSDLNKDPWEVFEIEFQ